MTFEGVVRKAAPSVVRVLKSAVSEEVPWESWTDGSRL